MPRAVKFGVAMVSMALLAAAVPCTITHNDNELSFGVLFIAKSQSELQPLIPVALKVEVAQRGKAGTNLPAKGDMFKCRPFTRVNRVVESNGTANVVHELALKCSDEQTFVIKGVVFEK